ncbi:hypothetical protein [Brevundimonas sp.]|uniref:hypothetical protein n=1 Tax=Brevundimonas sp. TaxID=1871086 RepID=UPI002737B4C2|nr:hypothetical protein [Brevundimonas sp.]MDP3803840.1 hypothetical protein [Brevundimonas sp.]
MIVAALFLTVALAAEPEPPPRTELCLAHMDAMIAEAQRETGMVAGPSWFIRSWWAARLPEVGMPATWSEEQRRALGVSMPERKAADPDGYRAELQACVAEAIDGGALP